MHLSIRHYDKSGQVLPAQSAPEETEWLRTVQTEWLPALETDHLEAEPRSQENRTETPGSTSVFRHTSTIAQRSDNALRMYRVLEYFLYLLGYLYNSRGVCGGWVVFSVVVGGCGWVWWCVVVCVFLELWGGGGEGVGIKSVKHHF